MVLDVDSTSRDAARAGNVMRFTLYGTAAPDADSLASQILTLNTRYQVGTQQVEGV